MTGITPEAFVLGLSGLGAGLAMICGIGTGIGPVSYTHLLRDRSWRRSASYHHWSGSRRYQQHR